jgi:hypothetical protein
MEEMDRLLPPGQSRRLLLMALVAVAVDLQPLLVVLVEMEPMLQGTATVVAVVVQPLVLGMVVMVAMEQTES